MVEQMRDIIHDVSLAPIEAPREGLHRRSRRGARPAGRANALLKTLEEPPARRRCSSCWPTSSTRCSRRSRRAARSCASRPSRRRRRSRCSRERAGVGRGRGARGARGGGRRRAARARLPALAGAARDARRRARRAARTCRSWTARDVLRGGTRTLLATVKAPLDELKAAQEAELRERIEFLGRKAGSPKPIEDRHKRELTAREREGVGEVLNVAESWLRDCLTRPAGAASLSRTATRPTHGRGRARHRAAALARALRGRVARRGGASRIM